MLLKVAEEKKKKKKTAARKRAPAEGEVLSIADELGVEDLNRTYFRKGGREFAAAGRKTPVAEIAYDGLVMYSPDKPLQEAEQVEEIKVTADNLGICLNELGERRKIVGARYKGRDLYWLAETAPGTTRHYVAWFDEEWQPHKIYLEGVPMTSDLVVKVRNRSVNGELSAFPEISSDS